MFVFETSRIDELTGGADIHELLDERLLPSGFPGGSARKFLVDGHPDLVVRKNRWQDDLEDAQRVAEAFGRLNEYGVNALPYVPITHNDKLYVVTQKVNGTELENVLHPAVTDDVVSSMDRTWAGLADYMRDAKVSDLVCARDVLAPHQYMVGTTATDPNQDVRLVDLDKFAQKFGEGLDDYDADAYGEHLVYLAGHIVGLEIATGRRLDLSRHSAELALGAADELIGQDDSYDKVRPLQVARFILANQHQYDMYEHYDIDELPDPA
ncbi:MAG: hypothetical protein JWP13_732 [Candidatus Saccharibacteria bacterium]|nr:hypothetical protein [Candidatus Saccharibacteria bacterium]